MMSGSSPSSSSSGHKLTVYEVLVARGKRRMMLESQENPFDRIEQQLRAAKRFRVEEYIRSLRPGTPLDEEEQRKRDAFFFGVARSTSPPTASSSASPSPSPTATPTSIPTESRIRSRPPAPATSSSCRGSPLSSPAVCVASPAPPGPAKLTAPKSVNGSACLIGIPATLANHPAMRMHRMCATADVPPLASLMQSAALFRSMDSSQVRSPVSALTTTSTQQQASMPPPSPLRVSGSHPTPAASSAAFGHSNPIGASAAPTSSHQQQLARSASGIRLPPTSPVSARGGPSIEPRPPAAVPASGMCN